MNTQAPTCATCGQPKTAKTAASFTQWIFSCRCDAIEQEMPEILLCSTCGMPIDEKKTGSFTQWVFKSQICTCEKPRPLVSNKQGDLRAVLQQVTQRHGSTSSLGSLNASNFPIVRYEPLEKLGAGGAGSVYLCFDNHLQKNVAVKVLKASDPEQLEAFQTEAKVTAKFRHANVISIIDFGLTESAAPYMVLEYVDGMSLESVIQNDYFVSDEAIVSLFTQISSALEKGHEEGIFHRDIKSSNIIVTSAEHGQLNAYIIDFGIAVFDKKGYQGKTLIGTPKYMSPDQFLGNPFDSRSEVYSIGCVLYEVLTGCVPFQSDDVISLLEKHASEKLRPPSEIASHGVNSDLEKIVLKCLEKNPDARFQSMGELVDALNRVSFDEVIEHSDSDTEEQSIDGSIPFNYIPKVNSPRSDSFSKRFLVVTIAGILCGLMTMFVARKDLLSHDAVVSTKSKNDFETKSPEIVLNKKAKKKPKEKEANLLDNFPGEAIQTPEDMKKLTELTKAIARKPDDPELYRERYKVLEAMDRNEEAALDIKTTIRLMPKTVLFREELVDLYMRLDRRDEAMKEINEAIKVGAVGARIYKFKAVILADDKKLEEALQAATQAVKLAPGYDGAWATRGLINYKLGRYQNAVDDYTVALKFAPNELRVLHGRADAYEKLNKHDLAMRDRKGGGAGDYGDLLNAVQIGASSMKTLIKKSQEVRSRSKD